MFKNCVEIAFRNILRHKGYSMINIFGLAIGIACCMIISLFVLQELSYDNFHENSENLYRVVTSGQVNGQRINYAVSMGPLGPALKTELPEIRDFARLYDMGRLIFNYQGKSFFETSILSVEDSFLDMFSYNLLRGNPGSVLKEPYSVVLTESLATKYFGDEDPLGKVLTLDGQDGYTVTGICQDSPTNSHLNFDALISLASIGDEPLSNWGRFNTFTYVELLDYAIPAIVSEKLNKVLDSHLELNLEEHGIEFRLSLQPISDIHLYSNLSYDIAIKSSITYVYIFSAIAIFILLIACINFMNLTTARSINRAREIGMRKVMGANRGKIALQFLGESILLTLIASFVAIMIVEIGLPLFNHLTGKELDVNLIQNWKMLGIGTGFIFIIGLLSGSYPALYLSSFNAIPIIKGKLTAGTKKPLIRNILVVTQFVISITLLSSTGIIYRQLQYFQHKKLGFDKEHVLLMRLPNEVLERESFLKGEFAQISGVKAVSNSNNFPASGTGGGHGFYPEGYSEEKPWLIKTIDVDYNFLRTFGIKIKQGRNFSEEFSSDSVSVVINETLQKELKWDQPIGKTLRDPTMGNREDGGTILTVVGVAEDFHINSLRSKIEPLLLILSPESPFLSIRLEPGNTLAAIDKIESKWEQLLPQYPFEYSFLDEQFDDMHQEERLTGKIFVSFTILAVFIACLGLFGLASFTTQRRTKEIGIRKVLGASVKSIVILLSKEFTKWVIIAFMIACPITYFSMNKWLENFAYKTNIDPEIFILSGLIGLIIALITVSFQTIRAAMENPVEALKYE